MAVRNLRAAIDPDPNAGTSASTAGASSGNSLLSLADDELSALMPSTLDASPSVRRVEAAATPNAARPSPKASGKFLTDGGRRGAPKIVKRIAKRASAAPNKPSGSYAKAVAPSTKTSSPYEAPTKLEDFSDLLKELEPLVDVPRPRQAGTFGSDVNVEESIAEAMKAALPQLATVPLSLATVAASAPSLTSGPRPEVLRTAMPVTPERSHEHLAHAPAAHAAASPTDEVRASPVPAPQPKRTRSILTAMMAIAALGIVVAGAWVGGGAWSARRSVASSQTTATAPVAPAAPAPESNADVAPAAVVAAATVSAEPQAAPAPVAADESRAAAPASSAIINPAIAAPAKPKTAPRQPAPPTAESAVATPAAEPASDARPAKPARRARSSKANDAAKTAGAANDEVDEETRKALEALHKSQLEASF